jgi:hypothetical protein
LSALLSEIQKYTRDQEKNDQPVQFTGVYYEPLEGIDLMAYSMDVGKKLYKEIGYHFM